MISCLTEMERIGSENFVLVCFLPVILKGPDMVGRDEVISDENLAESMSSQHFTGITFLLPRLNLLSTP